MPTSSNHAGGTWTYDEEQYEICADGAFIARLYTSDDFPCLDEDDYAKVEAECVTNGHLMAAAPDLLTALVALLHYVEDDNPGAVAADAWVSALCSDARNVLAKARGETLPADLGPEPFRRLMSAVNDVLSAGAYDGDEFTCAHEDAVELSDAYHTIKKARGES